MTLNFDNGKMIALIKNKNKKNNKILMIDDNNNKKNVKRIHLADEYIYDPLLDNETRSITYICGASGSGKSTFAKSLIEKFNILFPENNVYLISRLETDPAFDELERKNIIIRIPVDEDLAHQSVDIIRDIPENSMVVFDDIDTINDKKLINVLNNMKLQILEIGRHKKIYCIVTSHLINTNDRNSTRTMMNEMSNLVIFPRGGGSAYQQRYCLKNYLGLSKNEIDNILGTTDSRWVLISKNYPQYILTEKLCYLI